MNWTGLENASRPGIFLVALLLLLIPSSSDAQDSKLLTMLSPKLRRLLSENPGASVILSNAICGSFGPRSVTLRYFYSDDAQDSRAFHTYPDESSVCITVRENQLAIDEFICLIFESINSKSEKEFQDVYQQAMAGAIAKEEFSKRILKIEFTSVKQVRDLLTKISLDTEGSYYYDRFLKCPETFDEFLPYMKQVSIGRDPVAEYNIQYETIRKKQPALNQKDSFR